MKILKATKNILWGYNENRADAGGMGGRGGGICLIFLYPLGLEFVALGANDMCKNNYAKQTCL
jgi:hypothetical protein